MRRFFLLLAMLGRVAAQQEKPKRLLEPWMTGIIAVAVFLFLVFVAFIVNKAWCGGSSQDRKPECVKSNEYPMTNGTNCIALDEVRSRDHVEAYENVVMEDTTTSM